AVPLLSFRCCCPTRLSVNVTTISEINTLSLHDALPICKNQNVYQNFPINEQAVISKISDLEYNINIGEYDYIMETYQLRRPPIRSEEHTSELQSRFDLVCRLLLEKKKRHHV